jgi:hypothetical protein
MLGTNLRNSLKFKSVNKFTDFKTYYIVSDAFIVSTHGVECWKVEPKLLEWPITFATKVKSELKIKRNS